MGENKRYNISFQYADAISRWEWCSQECSLCATSKEEAIQKAKSLYGLGYDCDFRIISVTEA